MTRLAVVSAVAVYVCVECDRLISKARFTTPTRQTTILLFMVVAGVILALAPTVDVPDRIALN